MNASERMILNRPALECAWREGVCLCPCCGGVVRLVPVLGRTPRVVDADNRVHLCERYIAGVFARHGVAGMAPIIRKHAERPVIAAPLGADGRVPNADTPSQRRPRRIDE